MSTRSITRHTALVALASAAVLTFAGPSLAGTTPARVFGSGEATYELPQAVVVGQSRADVHAQVLQARAAGTPAITEASLQANAPFVALKTRADVAAEVNGIGNLAGLYGEPQGFAAPAVTPRGSVSVRMVAAR